MNPRTTLTLSNGCGLDLLDPKAADISFEVVAEHLAKENRYNGATRGVTYSVAQHSVHCAEIALKETGDEELAARLLCHDMHEAFLGDDTTPKKKALAAIIGSFGILAQHIDEAFALLTYKMDVAIHEAAGLTFPPEPYMRARMHHYDRLLLATEWRDLMKCETPFDFERAPSETFTVTPWPWGMAKVELLVMARELLPALRDQRRRELNLEVTGSPGQQGACEERRHEH